MRQQYETKDFSRHYPTASSVLIRGSVGPQIRQKQLPSTYSRDHGRLLYCAQCPISCSGQQRFPLVVLPLAATTIPRIIECNVAGYNRKGGFHMVKRPVCSRLKFPKLEADTNHTL